MGIIAFIIILGVLVLVHEAGHFFAARWTGVAAEEFGLGFPPRLFGWRRGQTLFSINAIPFGGFVRLVGEQGTEADRPDSFAQATPWKQLIILLAGVVMNFIFAWVVMAIVLTAGVRVDPSQLPTDRHVAHGPVETTVVVRDGSPASQAGLTDQDQLVSINGQAFTDTSSLVTYVEQSQYPSLEIQVLRHGQPVTVHVSPEVSQGSPKYGLGISSLVHMRYPWEWSPWYAVKATLRLASETIRGFGQLVRELFQGRVSQDVTGPIGIAVITTEVSRLGLIALLQFAAILSISLAILNVLPLPALDGGRIFLRLVGWVTRRPVSRQLEGAIHAVGFYLLVAFLLYISVRDFNRFDIFSRVTQFFR